MGVTIEDQYGNIITTGNTGSNDTIHVALSSGTFAAGTTSVAAVNGVANFSGLQITNAGNYTITATDTTHGAASHGHHEPDHGVAWSARTNWPSPPSLRPSLPAARSRSA